MNEPVRAPELEAPARDAFAAPLAAMIGEVRRGTARLVNAEETSVDEEAVHDFRVAIRRLRSVLRAVGHVYGRRKIRAISRELKRFADATGELRDEEVLHETLAELEVDPVAREALDGWMARRVDAARLRRARVIHTLRDELATELEAALLRLESAIVGHVKARKKRERLPLQDVARGALDEALGAVRDAHVDGADPRVMHELRIAFKRLRYAAEFLDKVAPPGALGDLAAISKSAAKMQKRLGELHDLDEATLRIGRAWGLAPAARAAVMAALAAARDRSARRALADLEALRPAL